MVCRVLGTPKTWSSEEETEARWRGAGPGPQERVVVQDLSTPTEEQPARAPTSGASARERWSYREDPPGAADWGVGGCGPKRRIISCSPGTQGPTELHIEGPAHQP